MRFVFGTILWASAAGLACGSSADVSGSESNLEFGFSGEPVARAGVCAELDHPTPIPPRFETTVSGIVDGTRTPSQIPLTPGQESAIVSIWSLDTPAPLCTGTFIGPRTLVTAAHCLPDGSRRCTPDTCGIGFEVRFGADPEQPTARVAVSAWQNHPRLDLAWMQTQEPHPPDVTPIGLSDDRIGTDRVGDTVEVAGHGKRFDGDVGRRFQVTTLVRVPGDEVWVDGAGRGGLCFGDSGGPILQIDEASRQVEVVGVLSRGSLDCLGEDIFAQVGAAPEFLQDAGVSDRADLPTTCSGPRGPVTSVGRCLDSMTLQECDGAQAVSRTCAAGTCGWNGQRHACLPFDPTCDAIPPEGLCEGEVLRWCERGQVQARNCGACGEQCVFSQDTQAHACARSECPDLGSAGRCASNVLEYCDDRGRFRQLDCAAFGQACGVEAGTARCALPPGTCPELGFEGQCIGDVAVFCAGTGLRELRWENCASLGLGCGFINDDIGFFCR